MKMNSTNPVSSALRQNVLLQRIPFNVLAISRLAALLFVCLVIVMGAGAVYAQSPKIYYVDCTTGVDSNPGTSTTQAWKSIGKANSAPLKPGDKLLFKRGCVWQGPIKAGWNGTAAQPITIGAYGTGNLPIIQDSYSSNVQITGSYLIIEYIETRLTTPPSPDARCNNQPVAWKLGFAFGSGSSYNTVQYSKASKLAIGVYLDYSSHHNKVLHNELVDNHAVWKLDQNQALGAMGILLHGDHQEIAYNYFSDNRTICTYNGVIESNSIELHGASYANIHHNTSINDRVFSELGSSTTYPSTDNVYAYNLHVSGDQPSSIGPRFLVTRGQGHSNGPVWRTKAYNNTVIHTGTDSKGITCQYCGSDVLVVKNNLFWVDREPISSDGPFIEEHNLFWATTGNPLLNFSKSLSSHVADPAFVDFAGQDFRLKSTSVAVNAGNSESIAQGYTTDLVQVAVPQSSAVDIGAYEVPGAAEPSPTPQPTPTPSPTPVAPSLAPCTISINDGAIYTGMRDVEVNTHVPDATQMMISSDAGFVGATWQSYASPVTWTLPDTMGRIATLLIYVRFSDANNTLLCGSQIGDDIIYDPVPPTVALTLDNLSLTSTGANLAQDRPTGDQPVDGSGAMIVGLSISATDQENGSGVERMQVSLDESFGEPTWQPYSPSVIVHAQPGQTIYVRVQDGTGNVSEYASVTVPISAPPADSPAELFIPQVVR